MFRDLSAFRRDPLAFFEERGRNSKESLVKLDMGLSPVYLVTDPELIKPIVKAAEQKIDKGRIVHKLRKMLGMSSITMSGPEHKQRRGVIHQHLARGMANNFIPEICATIRQQAALLAKEKNFEVHSATAPLALRVISSICFGRDTLTKGDEALLVESVNMVEDDLANSFFKILPDWPWVKRARNNRFKLAREIMLGVVNRSRKRCKSSSLLQSLEALNLPIEELRDEILMIFLAGHHTTGNAAVWLLYHMAQDKDLTLQLAEEAKIVMNDGEIDPQKLVHAALSLNFVKETLRLYPSFYWFSREAKQPLELGGKKLKKGTTLIISQWHMQRDPRFWDSPEEFRTNRTYTSAAYLPFGAGPRVCVGMGIGLMELQLICLEFAAAYEIDLASKALIGQPKGSVTIVPPEIYLSIKPRVSVSECGAVV